jgi:hypothetical protein
VAQKVESKEERQLEKFSLKNFLAVDTTNERLAPQHPESFYALENAQPVGFGNIHSIYDISAPLHNYAADTIYYDENVNLNNTEYLIQASTTGKLFAYNVPANTATQINGAAVLSGSGTVVVQWNNSNALIIDSTGYYSWSGAGNITLITGSGAPSSGQAIAVYGGIVWIAQNRTLTGSAPGSFTDFTVADGGFSTTLVDPVLRSNIVSLFAANGYLYVFGTSSVNSISDLYVPSGASPPTPVFTNLNLTAIVGTDQPSSVQTYGRLVLFANRWGVWSVYGTTVQSISSQDPNNAYSSAIDGTWQYADFTQAISGGQVVSNNLLCAAVLMRRKNDPVFGSNTIVLMYQGDAAGGKWWNANYGAVTRISTAFVNNSPALFGYIGNVLYQLFANSASAPAALVKTPLWDFDDNITQKEAIKGGVGISTSGANTAGLTLYLDTPRTSTAFGVSAIGQINWVNNLSATVQWVNSVPANVQWVPGVYQTYWGNAPRGYSKYIGFTLTTLDGTIFELNSFMLDYKWAARWVGS